MDPRILDWVIFGGTMFVIILVLAVAYYFDQKQKEATELLYDVLNNQKGLGKREATTINNYHMVLPKPPAGVYLKPHPDVVWVDETARNFIEKCATNGLRYVYMNPAWYWYKSDEHAIHKFVPHGHNTGEQFVYGLYVVLNPNLKKPGPLQIRLATHQEGWELLQYQRRQDEKGMK